MLDSLFRKIQKNPKKFAAHSTDFESLLASGLENMGYRLIANPAKEIEPQTRWKEIKQMARANKNLEVVNPFPQFDKHFVFQPLGGQQSFDFLIMDGLRLVWLEAKTSKKEDRPTWNSHVPLIDGIYVFCNTKQEDVTFFLGDSAASEAERTMLLNYWDEKLAEAREFNAGLVGQGFGFKVYARKAYENTLNLITNPDRKRLEDEVIAYLSEGGE
ncbi:MAG: hypothetical protein MPK62_04110 [Alphaproteobacteria bacterium]|nr:hypothetical protein [Alphaproteobacteria bacterium]